MEDADPLQHLLGRFRAGDPRAAEVLFERCRAELARYKQPKEIHFIAFEDFPRSASGKIQRHELEKRSKP